MGRVLAIDLGVKRIGLAISDENRIVARMLPILFSRSRLYDANYILLICKNLEPVDIIIIGYPLFPISNQESSIAKKVKNFSLVLQEQAMGKLLVILVDEYCTTIDAKSQHAGIRFFDSAAAMILLENFICNV